MGKIFKPCIFLLFALSLKQRKIIFKPGITLNQNINLYNETLVEEKVIRMNLKHNICTHYQFTVYVDCLGTQLYQPLPPLPHLFSQKHRFGSKG